MVDLSATTCMRTNVAEICIIQCNFSLVIVEEFSGFASVSDLPFPAS